MADDQELTPEEKLLRVIQKGDSPPPGAGVAAGDGGVAPGGVTASGTTAIASGIPPAGRGRILAVLNRVLAAAAVLFVLLAGYDTYLNMPANATVYPAEQVEIGARSLDIEITSLSDTLDMFARRRMFGQVERPIVTPGNTNIVSLIIGWRAYARENLTLMGMSDVKRMQDGAEQTVREAIVMDNKLKKMLFLRQGSTLVLAEQDVDVASVEEAAIEFRKGEELLKIE